MSNSTDFYTRLNQRIADRGAPKERKTQASKDQIIVRAIPRATARLDGKPEFTDDDLFTHYDLVFLNNAKVIPGEPLLREWQSTISEDCKFHGIKNASRAAEFNGGQVVSYKDAMALNLDSSWVALTDSGAPENAEPDPVNLTSWVSLERSFI